MDILGNVDFSAINNLFIGLLIFAIVLTILIAFATIIGKALRLRGALLKYFVVASLLITSYLLVTKFNLVDM